MPEGQHVRRELSTAQSGIWFGHKFDPTGHIYNVGEFVEIHGDIDVAIFERAFRFTFSEVETLRLRFSEEGGRVWQWVDDSIEPNLTVQDFSTGQDGPAQEDAKAKAIAWIRAEFARPVDLMTGALSSFALLRISADLSLWYARSHHIAADSYGGVLFQRRFSEIYSLLMQGMPYESRAAGSLDALLDEQGSQRDSEKFAKDREYWLGKFPDLPEAVSLTGRTAKSFGDFLRLADALPADDIDRLLGVAKRARTAWSVVTIAAIAAYLHKISGRRDIIIGLPVTGRTSQTARSTPGTASDVLALRFDIKPAETFEELTKKVSREVRSALRHQSYRSEDLVRELRSRGRDQPLWNVTANIITFDEDIDFTGSPTIAHNLSNGPVRDLCIVVRGASDGSGLSVEFDGNSNIYEASELKRHHRGFMTLFRNSILNPDRLIGRIDVLDATERERILGERILGERQRAERQVPNAVLPKLFERQAAARPDAVAVVFEDQQLTYRELNERANRLARYLIGQGAGPEGLVGLALPRSAELVVVLLAVLKSGAGYVPIDPEYPADRIAAMLDDAQPVLLITDTETASALPNTDGVCRVLLDEVATMEAVGHLSAADVTDADRSGVLLPQHPAYVIYTSGSTGKPKGVSVPHRNVVRLFSSTQQWFHFGDADVWTMFHSYAFDFSVWETWGPLLHGGRLVVVTHVTSRSPESLLRLVRDEGVTVLNQTPTAFAQLMQADSRSDDADWASSLRFIIFGGEALDARRLADWYESHSADGPTLVNMYGITETTVHVTCAPLGKESPTEEISVVGRQIPDLRVYVLDAGLSLVPVGVAGELYVAGAGLARGYVNQPGLTAERFVADPFGGSGGRMYRTGDVVRWRADGVLEFAGRADAQVKVRGFRIEPGEIEAVLASHDSVGQAAVLIREDRPGDKRLVAYVVPAQLSISSVSVVDADTSLITGSGSDTNTSTDSGVVSVVDVSVLRGVVGECLPDYMVPSAFVVLDALPLTPNGKLDRQALPAPEVAAKVSGRGPRSPREEVLCSLFAEVLGVGKVGIDDSFFDLGGHSLLATRLVSRIRSVLDVEVSIRALFEAPTVAGLASHVDGAAGAVRVRLAGGVRPQLVPVSFAQRRLWFLGELEGPSATYNIPLTVRLRGALDVGALRAALVDVVGRHESLRTVFPQVDGRPYQHILSEWDEDRAAGLLRVGEVDASGLGGVLAAEASAGFDLSVDLPLRVRLCVVGPDEFVLIAVVHHIAADGWSMAPFARDLSLAYQARSRGEAPAWSVLPVQYADYTLWQREVLGSEDDPDSVISHQLNYWTNALAGVPEQLELPTDFPRPSVASHAGDTVPIHVPADVHERLIALARESSTSLFMTVQAALAVLLQRMGAGEDIPIGTPVAGRTDDALDELIGFFVNTLVLRTDTSGDPSFRELLGRVRETDLAAFANQDVPFERLVEVLNPQRSMARHPLFQVMLAFQNNAQPTLDLPGLHVEHQTLDGAVAKFDLTLNLGEHHTPEGQPDGLTGRLDYRTDLFHPTTIETLATRLNQVLATVVTTPDLPIGQVDVLTPTERDQLLVEWNDTARDVPETVLPQLFEAQVMATPDAVAVVFEDQQLTYRELNARANQLARYLIGQGAGPEGLVGLALPRSAELIVALLAVLKSGAGYVPIDPEYPADRIAFMLADAQPVLLITDTDTASALPNTEGVCRVLLDDEATIEAIGQLSAADVTDTDRSGALLPQHPAYVIYTSGSTGRPKGVTITHQALVNYVVRCPEAYPHLRGTSVLHASVSFDAGVTVLYGALICGGRVRVTALDATTATQPGPGDTVTFMKLTPSHLPLLQNTALEPTGQLMLGGEAIPGEAVTR
ncbi:non-ribosomal peptide synthetase, partial [Streptomyces albipurpureus]